MILHGTFSLAEAALWDQMLPRDLYAQNRQLCSLSTRNPAGSLLSCPGGTRPLHFLLIEVLRPDGYAEKEEEGPLDGQERLGQVLDAVHHFQQLCRKGRSTTRGDHRRRAQPCKVHG